MDIKIFNDEVEASTYVVNLYKHALENGAEVFGLATGSTPEEFYKQLTQTDCDFSDKVSINLDEYYGLSRAHPKSYHTYMQKQLFDKKPFKHSYLPDGKTTDLSTELKRYDDIIANNPIDVQLLGIGVNGHIGFNEPGAPVDGKTQLVNLTPSTIETNSRFFTKTSEVPTQAISMGLGSILKAKKIILLAFGEEKADAIKKTVAGPATTQVPASILQNHPDVTLVLDQAAASQL